jgi:hypothetical protein
MRRNQSGEEPDVILNNRSPLDDSARRHGQQR